MSIQYQEVQINPLEIQALHNLICKAADGDDKDISYRWLAYARSTMFEAWQALPDGHHLKDAYRDEAWKWDDQDLAAIPDEARVGLDAVRALAADLEVGDE